MNNTLIMVASDNGASAEAGLGGTSNEQRLLNGIPEDSKPRLFASPEAIF
jgi:hypothetical protein